MSENLPNPYVKLDQMILSDPSIPQYGDCLRACTAMMLNKDMTDIMHFAEQPERFQDRFINWLIDKGYNVHFYKYWPLGVRYAIAIGPSPRRTAHAVVCKDGVLWHDPHPSHDGIRAVIYFITIERAVHNDVPIYVKKVSE